MIDDVFQRRRRGCVLAIALALVFPAFPHSVAFAADAADRARAQQLFDDAKALMDQGKFADACPKLEESQRLDPADGTLLRYAWCEEELGKYATAWVLFKDGLARVKAANNAVRIKFASDHLASIEPKLSKVTIGVSTAAASVSGLEVRWDGKTLDKTEWNTTFPVDPGKHSLSAIAPGRETYQTSVDVGAVGDQRKIDVPVLIDPSAAKVSTAPPIATNAPPPPPTTIDAEPTSSGGGVPGAAWVAFGTAGALLTTAIVARVEMNGALSTMKDDCAVSVACSDDDRSRVRRWEAVSWVAGVGAVAATGVGIYFVTRPTSQHSGPSAGVRIIPTTTALSLIGSVAW